jgi:hypothetical protein
MLGLTSSVRFGVYERLEQLLNFSASTIPQAVTVEKPRPLPPHTIHDIWIAAAFSRFCARVMATYPLWLSKDYHRTRIVVQSGKL